MEIRLATPLDEEKIKAFSNIEWPPVDRVHFNNEAVSFEKQYFTFISEEGDSITGYIKLIIDMGVCIIDSLLVGEGHRGKGIAQSLLSQAEARAKELGCHKMWLETGIDWEAKAFYEKRGYGVVLIMNNHYAHKDFVIMEKEV